jgi:hypothetical protein
LAPMSALVIEALRAEGSAVTNVERAENFRDGMRPEPEKHNGTCGVCGTPLTQGGPGRKARFCGAACLQRPTANARQPPRSDDADSDRDAQTPNVGKERSRYLAARTVGGELRAGSDKEVQCHSGSSSAARAIGAGLQAAATKGSTSRGVCCAAARPRSPRGAEHRLSLTLFAAQVGWSGGSIFLNG